MLELDLQDAQIKHAPILELRCSAERPRRDGYAQRHRLGRPGRCNGHPLRAPAVDQRCAAGSVPVRRRRQFAGRGSDGRRADLQHRVRRSHLQRDAMVATCGATISASITPSRSSGRMCTACSTRLMHHMDDPIADVSIFPTYLVSKLAAAHVKVVLSGDGGDELFGGYETFLAQEKARTCGEACPAGCGAVHCAAGARVAADRRKERTGQQGQAIRRGREPRSGAGPRPLAPVPGREHRQRAFHGVGTRAPLTSPIGAHIAKLNAGGRRARLARPRAVRGFRQLPGRQLPHQGGPDVHGLFDRGPRAAARQGIGRAGIPRSRKTEIHGQRDQGVAEASGRSSCTQGLRLSPQAGLQHSDQELAERGVSGRCSITTLHRPAWRPAASSSPPW